MASFQGDLGTGDGFICVCSLSRLSQINAKIRNVCKKHLSVVYTNNTVLLGIHLTILT